MEIGITLKNKTVFNQEIDIQKSLIKGLQIAGLVTIGTIIYSNSSSAITTAFADQISDRLIPSDPYGPMKDIVELIKNPSLPYLNMRNDVNILMDSFSKFVQSMSQF